MKKVLLSVVALMSLATATLAQSVPNYVPTNGLVGWWPFNGNANDESGNGNNGTVNGATLTTDRFGNVGKAYSFDGINDYINYGTNVNMAPTNISISGWFKATILNNNVNVIIRARGNGYNVYLKGDGKIQFDCNQLSMNGINVVSQNQYNNSNWHNFTVTFGQDSLGKLYVDGSLVNSIFSSFGNNIFYNLLGISIGRDGDNNIYFYRGELDDIGMWNRALTQQEVTDLYNANICYDHVTVTDTLIINTNMVGFNPVTYQNTIKVWPNPAHDHITIDNGNIANLNGYQIKISNVLGQQVFQSAINQQQFYINLSTWTGNGTYYINLINPQGVTVETRVIVVQ